MKRIESLAMLVDSHAHLDAEEFNNDREKIISSLWENGIESVISVSDSLESAKNILNLAGIYKNIFCTAGFHPHNASKFTEEIMPEFKKLAEDPNIRAIGEIGLDYHYNFSPPEQQAKVFAKFLELAVVTGKPVVIHNRKSEKDLISILYASGKKEWRGVIHCFDSNTQYAKIFLDMGFLISFSGMITFSKAMELQSVVSYVPLGRMLIETDSPYLTPHPNRGKRNEPAFVKYVALKVAEIKKLPFEEVARQTRINAYNFFGINA